MNSIGKKIKTLRIERGLSQQQLADILNVSRQAISKWESAESYPDLEKIISICIFFEVTSDFLLGIKDQKIKNLKDTVYKQRSDNIKKIILPIIVVFISFITLLSFIILSLISETTYYNSNEQEISKIWGYILHENLLIPVIICVGLLVVGFYRIFLFGMQEAKKTKKREN